MKKEMEECGRLDFVFDNEDATGYCKELKAKTLKGMFAEAQRILSKIDKSKFVRITLTYGIVFAPVPSYAGDCKYNVFVLFDKKEEKRY